MPYSTMSMIHSLGGFISRRREIRAVLRTERMIASLPRDIRKDIGWPDFRSDPTRWRG